MCASWMKSHPIAFPGLLTGHLQGQRRFACAWPAADDKQVAGGQMQVLVKYRKAGWNIAWLFIQLAHIIVY